MYQAILLLALSGSSSAVAQHGYYGSNCNVQHAVAAMHEGKLVLKTYMVVQQPETHVRDVPDTDKDGKTVYRKETYSVTRSKVETTDMRVELDKVKGLDSEGKVVSLVGRLTKPTRVLMSFDEQAFDSTYRSILRKDALFLIVKGNGGTAPAAAHPAPKVLATPPEKGASPKPPPAPGESEPPPAIIQVEAVVQPPKKLEAAKDNAKDSADLPTGPAPGLATAALDGKGDLCLQEATGRVETAKGHYDEVANGVVKKVPVQIKVTNFSMTERSIPVKAVQGLTATGQSITGDALLQRLRRPATVLVSPAGRVDPFYLQVFREDVLILVAPTIQQEAIPVPQPAGAPTA